MATPYCTRKPDAAERDAVCPDCGHAALLHIGVGHCPVCEIVAFSAKARRQPVTPEQVARGEKTINDMRAYLGMPPLTAEDVPPITVTVHIHGGVLTERQVGDMVERAMLRAGMRNPTSYSPYRRL